MTTNIGNSKPGTSAAVIGEGSKMSESESKGKLLRTTGIARHNIGYIKWRGQETSDTGDFESKETRKIKGGSRVDYSPINQLLTNSTTIAISNISIIAFIRRNNVGNTRGITQIVVEKPQNKIKALRKEPINLIIMSKNRLGGTMSNANSRSNREATEIGGLVRHSNTLERLEKTSRNSIPRTTSEKL